MEEILKIYNDGSHFVGTKFIRSSCEIIEQQNFRNLDCDYDIEYKMKESISKGSTYDSKEFYAENFRKRKNCKYFDDERIKEIYKQIELNPGITLNELHYLMQLLYGINLSIVPLYKFLLSRGLIPKKVKIDNDLSFLVKKKPTFKDYDDCLKNLILSHCMDDLSFETVKDIVSYEFIQKMGDIVFYNNQQGKAFIMDSTEYLKKAFKRLGKNFKERVKRFKQKAFNNKWNYFVTLTYDDSIHTEETFLKKIKRKLSNLHSRKGWLYMGVFERSSSGRLHFHGLFNVPKGEMVGELIEVQDYSTEHHKMQIRHENTSFKESFGINDFESLESEDLTKGNVLNYILKYIGKTGEPIYYSRGIKTFIYIKLNDPNDYICRVVNFMATRYVLFDDCLIESIEINVKRLNC